VHFVAQAVEPLEQGVERAVGDLFPLDGGRV